MVLWSYQMKFNIMVTFNNGIPVLDMGLKSGYMS